MKYYQAKDPERLVDYLDERQRDLNSKKEQLKLILPRLREEYKEQKTPMSEVYEGIKGFKTLYEWILKEAKKGDCVQVMGAPKIANEKFQGYFLDWNKRR